MTKREQIETHVSALSDDDLRKFASWFDELRWERWDRQIEADSQTGRLDALVADAKAQAAAGKFTTI